ncbi:hypothetical protein H4R24_000036 [Coemansia sp. RSA 988]|nr:hypothetical protein H4R24_000036 [Coemansia sp. RSA 988]
MYQNIAIQRTDNAMPSFRLYDEDKTLICKGCGEKLATKADLDAHQCLIFPFEP